MNDPPGTRSGTRNLREEFNKALESLIHQNELEDITKKMDQLSIRRDTSTETVEETIEVLDAKQEDINEQVLETRNGAQIQEEILSIRPCQTPQTPTIEWPLLKTNQGLSLCVISHN